MTIAIVFLDGSLRVLRNGVVSSVDLTQSIQAAACPIFKKKTPAGEESAGASEWSGVEGSPVLKRS